MEEIKDTEADWRRKYYEEVGFTTVFSDYIYSK